MILAKVKKKSVKIQYFFDLKSLCTKVTLVEAEICTEVSAIRLSKRVLLGFFSTKRRDMFRVFGPFWCP